MEESPTMRQNEIDQIEQSQSKWKRYLRIICCVSQNEDAADQDESQADEQFRKTQMIDVRETKMQFFASAINSIIMVVGAMA